MSSKSYSDVTESIFDCIKAASEQPHGTRSDPPDSDSGTATTKTAVGTVQLGFVLSGGTLTYSIERKPGIVTDSEIWDGIGDTVNRCRNS